MAPGELTSLSLPEIAKHCAQESKQFFRRQKFDPRYCFEIFRRAIVSRDRLAWEAIYAQYRPLVSGWVIRHPAFMTCGEESQYFVNRAFEKMWASLTPDKFDKFPDLKFLFRYLQMCVHSEIIDYVRRTERMDTGLALEQLPEAALPLEEAVETEALGRIRNNEIWQWFEKRLNNEKERKVIYGLFVLALKPRELYTHEAGYFNDVGEIYRIKENVLSRIRRDPELKGLINQDD